MARVQKETATKTETAPKAPARKRIEPASKALTEHEVDARSIEMPDAGEVKFTREDGEIKKVVEHDLDDQGHDIELISDFSNLDSKIAKLKFLEEPIKIMIQQTAESNGNSPVFLQHNNEPALGVNGPWLERGVVYTVKRRFAEVLFNAKTSSYGNVESVDDGVRGYVYPQSRTLKYPFSIMEDKSPLSAQWQMKCMREA